MGIEDILTETRKLLSGTNLERFDRTVKQVEGSGKCNLCKAEGFLTEAQRSLLDELVDNDKAYLQLDTMQHIFNRMVELKDEMGLRIEVGFKFE